MRTAREALAAARAAPEEAARAVKVQQLVERELLARLVASEFGDSLTTSLEKRIVRWALGGDNWSHVVDWQEAKTVLAEAAPPIRMAVLRTWAGALPTR